VQNGPRRANRVSITLIAAVVCDAWHNIGINIVAEASLWVHYRHVAAKILRESGGNGWRPIPCR
jgi:hypothetical protein